MKKIIVWLLAAAAAGSLAACAGQEGGAQQNAAAEAKGKAEADDGESVSIWCWDETFNIPAAEAAADIYREKAPDFQVEITNLSFDDIVTRLTTAAAGGQEDTFPDIMLMSDTNIKKFVTLYPEYFADLTESGIDFSQFADYKVEARLYDEDERQRILDEDTVEAMTEMMEKVILEGTGKRAQLPFFAAGKTGTSQDYRDAWFVGFTDRYVAAVWIGNDDNSPMKGVGGGTLPAEIWKKVMLAAESEE